MTFPKPAIVAFVAAFLAGLLRSMRLLNKALERYCREGRALAKLSRQGECITHGQYVYVISANGIMLANDGPSAILTDQDITPLLHA